MHIFYYTISCCNSFCSKSKHYTRVYNSAYHSLEPLYHHPKIYMYSTLNYTHECSASTFNRKNCNRIYINNFIYIIYICMCLYNVYKSYNFILNTILIRSIICGSTYNWPFGLEMPLIGWVAYPNAECDSVMCILLSITLYPFLLHWHTHKIFLIGTAVWH